MKKAWVFWVIGFSIVLSILACGVGSDAESGEGSIRDDWDREKLNVASDAYNFCNDLVKENLKEPSKAVFLSLDESATVNTSGNKWAIISFVFAKNSSSGEVARIPYSCELTYMGNGKFRVESYYINDLKIK
ncbi:MAG: hypothetical protein JW866_03120 [Ignavibacteriales bacterium]|nr:hypothetical protein [Ignavibacteriales bacterium]